MRSGGTTIAKLGPAGRIAWVAAADFNSDGAADIAALDVARDVIASFAADGRGAVSESTAHFSANSTVAVADFNGDGRPDLAVADPDRSAVVVLSGEAATRSLPRARHGNGRFRETFEAPAGGGSLALAVADFNFDGRPDIAMLAGMASRLTVLINDGQGFRASVTEVGPSGPRAPSLAAADFDGDGRIDLAAGGSLTPFLLLGNGDGSFRALPPLNFLSGNLAAGDFNNDGRSDLAVLSDRWLTMLLGGSGEFSRRIDTPGLGGGSSIAPVWTAVGDLNGDGNQDLLVDGRLYLGAGDGTFRFALTYGGGGRAVISDLNGDGRADVAIPSGDSILTFLAQDR
jgi:hypothetical protein